MTEREIRIDTPDGSMRAYVAHPDEGGPFPLVVMLMDAPGYRAPLQAALCRYASAGYFGVLPDLYYRDGDLSFDPAQLAAGPEGEEMKRMFETMSHLSDEMAMSDVRAIVDFAESEDAARTPAGCVGYCMGGRLVVRAMAAFPDVFAAGSSIHPARVVTDGPDSPHLDIAKIRGELYFGCGENDGFTTPEIRATLQETADAAGVRCEIDVFADAQHGFAVAGGRNYLPEASERHFERTLEVFRRNLSESAVTA
jgi:carboxymethylenebutenolidase